MRIRDWSSDVCAADLIGAFARRNKNKQGLGLAVLDSLQERRVVRIEQRGTQAVVDLAAARGKAFDEHYVSVNARTVEIGYATCRDRVAQTLQISVVTGP